MNHVPVKEVLVYSALKTARLVDLIISSKHCWLKEGTHVNFTAAERCQDNFQTTIFTKSIGTARPDLIV